MPLLRHAAMRACEIENLMFARKNRKCHQRAGKVAVIIGKEGIIQEERRFAFLGHGGKKRETARKGNAVALAAAERFGRVIAVAV